MVFLLEEGGFGVWEAETGNKSHDHLVVHVINLIKHYNNIFFGSSQIIILRQQDSRV